MLAPVAVRRASSPTVAWAAIIPSRAVIAAARRAFRTVPSHRRAHGAPRGSKPPAEDSVAEDDANTDSQAATETSGGRVRRQAVTAASRARQARKHVASALPPVNLPRGFLDNNVSIFTRDTPPTLPAALAEDKKHPKVSCLFSDDGPGSLQKRRALAAYFDAALELLLSVDRDLARDFADSRSDETNVEWNSSSRIENVTRHWDVILDSAWHFVDAVYPARRPEYIYDVRPFWWWDVYKDYDPQSHTFRHKQPTLTSYVKRHAFWAQNPVYTPAHAFLDLPVETISSLTSTIRNEVNWSRPPPNFDAKRSKRPINILSLSGHGGSSISEALGAKIAHTSGADLIRLDAYDLSILVGEYLGQDWAYTRGGLSMLGFRAAELNGKLPREPDITERPLDDEDNDGELGGHRVVSGTLDDELQKIRQGASDCFSKWENLKVDKILDHIIRSAELKSPSSSSRPHSLLIQVHDIVELSMTLEGAQLISRLRALVDAAWQDGAKIAVLGTSSCEQPSQEYQAAIQDLAASDLVITRHIEGPRVDSQTVPAPSRSPFSLQRADYFVENMRNVGRMMRAINSESASRFPEPTSPRLWYWFDKKDPDTSMLRESILPAPEIYDLASAYCAYERHNVTGVNSFGQRMSMGPLRQKLGQSYPGEKFPEEEAKQGSPPPDQDQNKTHPRTLATKLNDYEKRVAAGQIDREKLRTTFADVRAPPETISALKLLTSLTLVRPDAFSYGVLAQDRIPGCLLYGPPGTGKTMVAKAVAKESGANMLEISGATIHDKWVGESEKLIRAVFTLAKRLSPCVVFIDEADALLASRNMAGGRAVHREQLNQFLCEWDGVQETNAFIMVATNRPYDLDDAVLRRLPRKILLDLPTRDDRAAILRLLLRGETLDDSVAIDAYAERTNFYSGSDLKNVCVAAAMAAVEEENAAAARHEGPEPFRYPDRRILRAHHFEKALGQIPANIGENTASLQLIRKFDDEYGSGKAKGSRKNAMGFGVVDRDLQAMMTDARVRRGSNP